MALYALALIVALAIPFLLYCLWNFARELKPHRKRAQMYSTLPNWGSVQAMPIPRLRPRNPLLSSGTRRAARVATTQRLLRFPVTQRKLVFTIDTRAGHLTQ